MICRPLLRFIRSSIHAVLSAALNKKRGYAAVGTAVKRNGEKPGQIGSVLRLSPQRLLQLARPFKKNGHATATLRKSLSYFS